jgi:hypothetical protein
MFCSSCGTQVDNNVQFCPNCGTKFIQIPTAPEGGTIPPITPIPPPPPLSTSPPFSAGIASKKASGRAVTSLVLGILGLTCCGIMAPIAWILGSMELKDIGSGLSSSAGKGYATAGKILGIIGTILIILSMVFAIVWFMLGMSMFAFRAPFAHHYRPF